MSKNLITVTVLERLHTLLVIGVGSAVGIVLMTVLPHGPGARDEELAWLLVALALAYGAAFLTDVLVGFAVRPFLRAAGRKRDQVAISPARTKD